MESKKYGGLQVFNDATSQLAQGIQMCLREKENNGGNQ